jgi:hypothetical protein
MQKTLKSYFFWTHQRGSFHYDVMVTLILLFIFITPLPAFRHIIDYGDKAPTNTAFREPIQVVSDGDYGLLLTVPVQDVQVDLSANARANAGASAGASIRAVRKALHRAIQPVTGDAVSVIRWETVSDSNGQPTQWKVWVHR